MGKEHIALLMQEFKEMVTFFPGLPDQERLMWLNIRQFIRDYKHEEGFIEEAFEWLIKEFRRTE